MNLGAIIGSSVLMNRLHRIMSELPKSVDKAEEATAQDVAGRAQARASSMGSVHGHVASGIGDADNSVELNVADQPAILGAEFGGGGRPRTRQFPPYTPDGYMTWPELTSDETLEFFAEQVGESLDD